MAYRFDDNILKIDIEGKIYPVNFSKNMRNNVDASKQELNKLKAEGCDNDEIVCSAIDNAIDSILGKGSSAEIFKGREPQSVERLSVLMYIFGEIQKFGNRRMKNVPPKFKHHRH